MPKNNAYKEALRIDDNIYSGLNEIERLIGVTNYGKIKTIIQGLLIVSEEIGEIYCSAKMANGARISAECEKTRSY